jgi:hypothetical protein
MPRSAAQPTVSTVDRGNNVPKLRVKKGGKQKKKGVGYERDTDRYRMRPAG